MKMLDAMNEATRLTRQGRRKEATRLLQRVLGASSEADDSATNTPSDVPRGSVEIDGAVVTPKTKRADRENRSDPASNPGRTGTKARKAYNTASLADRLRPGRVRARAKRSGNAAPSVASGASYEWREHRGPHGSRRYRFYLPADRTAVPMPLVLMLHGCTQNADDFAAGTRICEAADRFGVAVALPEQPREANAMGCWNWFEPAHQTATRGEPAILRGVIDEILRSDRIDRARVFVAGLSAGGAMAATLGATHPDMFAGICVHSGLAHGSAKDTASAFAAMQNGPRNRLSSNGSTSRLFIVHGDADSTVAPINADALFASVEGAAGEVVRDEPGRRVTDLIAADGAVIARQWRVPGLAHAWSGGAPGASYTAPTKPDATDAMLRFFLKEDA